MRLVLWLAGWLCLIGLIGLVFSSNRDRGIAASRPSASSLLDSRQGLASTSSQILARPEQPEGPSPEKGFSGLSVAAAASSPPDEIVKTLPAASSEGSARQAVPDREELAFRTRAGDLRPNPLHQPASTGPLAQQARRLRIPVLRVDVPVVQVRFDQVTWDFAGIEQEVAQLGSLSGEPASRNLALAGHVTVFNGGHGPFRYLHWLKPGDNLIVVTDRTIQTYQVREQIVVKPEDVSVTENTTEPQLTLITCTDWSEGLKTYQRRRVILADLVSIEPKREIRQ